MIKNIKLQVWEANGRVILRVENDVPNGSSISADGQSLVKALLNLAEVITCVRLDDDPVWDEPIISGGDDNDTNELGAFIYGTNRT
ncbi:MAG: hypothetical protein KME45_02870 [Stenomitos rutilans HA7619-LM2]|jgi:hypothetical protein|nr:hypothetical protein [Stenomitos rutilans HA7619-LM2]MBW4469326.1 hypothetical protein [Stenomitos rutilans HA7619-LM2]